MCLAHAQQGQAMDAALFAEIHIDLFHFYEKSFFNLWKAPVQYLLLAVCRVSRFTSDMAAFLSGQGNVPETLEYCRNVGSFLDKVNPDLYEIRDELRAFLKWKQEILWTRKQIEANMLRIARYYELQGDLSKALGYYQEAGDTDAIRQILIQNAQQHPGIGQYEALRPYYEALPPESIRNSPVLMAAMSMLYSLTLRNEESETWYSELKTFTLRCTENRSLNLEARTWLAYLEICLPHHAGKGLIRILREIHKLSLNENIVIPEMSVTGNCPSLLNGNLDFCEWTKNDGQIARFLQKPIESIPGRNGRGLINVALAESGFECGTLSPYEVVTRLNNGYAAACHGGSIEIAFAAQSVLIRQHLSEGQLPTARQLLLQFEEKVKTEGANHLLPNLTALSVWLALYTSDTDCIPDFLAAAPNIHRSFYVPDHYRYMVMMRCLIVNEAYSEALNLAGYLFHYIEQYKRTYLHIELETLKAIALHRTGQPEWQQVFENALRIAGQYHLIRIISMEGAAVLPLLNTLPGKTYDFRQEVLRHTRKMALTYPEYMKRHKQVSVELTARETEVLALLCAGKTTDEICSVCGISYNGLKKHNRSIYAKLGVSSRAEAERTALRLGLIHR